MKEEIVNQFHRLYYEGGGRMNLGGAPDGMIKSHWMGWWTQKCPLDLWVYQEIIYECRPRLIVEFGTAAGGTALYLAHLCDALKDGEVISVDIVEGKRPHHPRIHYLTGDVCSERIFNRISVQAELMPTMFILDDDHKAEHVLEEMNLYSDLVSPGQYMIVEDTNVNGHPVSADHGPGPMEAVEQFLGKHPEFHVDKTREKYLMTLNPNGYLKKYVDTKKW
jgi:cephalosporin hydroxylase